LPQLQSLIKDIHDVIQNPKDIDPAVTKAFGEKLARVVTERLSEKRRAPSLRVSNLGTLCDRKLWYILNQPERAIPLSAPTKIKFLFGAILEELLLFFAKIAGHSVTDEQAEVDVHGVKGHIDGVIDGELVDAKSASTMSFRKFRDHTLPFDDAFGYLTQLGAYGTRMGSGKNHFLAIDKQHGDITLDSYDKDTRDWGKYVDDKRASVSSKEPPRRAYEDETDGASGNRKLGVACSYCDFKRECWPGLRVFAYKSGSGTKPRFLTHVARTPDVPEMKFEDTDDAA
jgi:hypothetical protein